MVCRDEPHADFQKCKEIEALQKNMSGTKTYRYIYVPDHSLKGNSKISA